MYSKFQKDRNHQIQQKNIMIIWFSIWLVGFIITPTFFNDSSSLQAAFFWFVPWGDPNSGGDSRIFDDLFVDVKKILGKSILDTLKTLGTLIL